VRTRWTCRRPLTDTHSVTRVIHPDNEGRDNEGASSILTDPKTTQPEWATCLSSLTQQATTMQAMPPSKHSLTMAMVRMSMYANCMRARNTSDALSYEAVGVSLGSRAAPRALPICYQHKDTLLPDTSDALRDARYIMPPQPHKLLLSAAS
jgi:hypothetical protein